MVSLVVDGRRRGGRDFAASIFSTSFAAGEVDLFAYHQISHSLRRVEDGVATYVRRFVADDWDSVLYDFEQQRGIQKTSLQPFTEAQADVFELRRPFIIGASLSRIVAEGGMRRENYLPVALSLAGAVADAHDLGLVLQNLTLENVIWDEGRKCVVLVDFGIHRITDELVTGDERWKFALLGPEGLEKGRLVMSMEMDIWRLGLCLFSLFTGRHAWSHPNGMRNAAAIQRGEVEIDATIPPNIGSVIKECLSADPDRRPSAADIRRRLEPYMLTKRVRSHWPMEAGVMSRGGAPGVKTVSRQKFPIRHRQSNADVLCELERASSAKE